MAPHSSKLKLMRVVVREDFSRARCDSLVADIKASVLSLNKSTGEDIEKRKIAFRFHTPPCSTG